MTLQTIPLETLTISPLNVRTYGAKDCADLVASIRALGLLQPLLVRPNGDSFDVVAGQRRLNALRILAKDDALDPIPCLVMGAGEDAAAIEASLAENIARLPMDDIDQYKAFAKLVSEGRSVEEIAAGFGISERLVHQRLALGQLHGPILTAYRKGELHARDIRILTMATSKQQKEWWALVKDDDAYVPTGQRLKDWLFGGAHVPVSNALFDVHASGLAVVSDLFGEEAYFADSAAFWEQQNAAIAQRVAGYQEAGWTEVIVMDVGVIFATWKHRKTPKTKGGKVYIACASQGEITAHEGYLTIAEARRREKAALVERGEDAPKPELTKPAQNYVDLHRHAALRADVLGQSALALRLIAAHMIAGSDLWSVEADRQAAMKPQIADSLAANGGAQAMKAERAAIQTLLAMPEEDDFCRPDIMQVFAKLSELSEDDVLRILTFLMAETLSVSSPLIDTLGTLLGTEMRQHWHPDQAFFDLIRDKQVLNAMVGEYAGNDVAAANVTETAKTQLAILTACLDGTRSAADPNWCPRYMDFPQGSYRDVRQAEMKDEGLHAIAAE